MLATGGLAHEATIFYKHVASLLSAKWVMNTLWPLVGFDVALDFLRSGLLFSAFKVPIHPLVFSIGLHHQWI